MSNRVDRTHIQIRFAGMNCLISGERELKQYFEKYFAGTTVSVREAVAKDVRFGGAEVKFIQTNDQHSGFSFTQKNLKYTVYISGDMHFYYPLVAKLLIKVFTNLIYESGGLVLHASAVQANDKAYIFLGNSGAGKSTIAMLSQEHAGYHIIADNHVFLRLKRKKCFVHPFPFSNLFCRNNTPRRLGIRGAYIISKDSSHFLSKLTFMQAVHILNKKAQMQLPQAHVRLKKKYIKTLFNLLRTTNFYQLNFAQNSGFWEKIMHTGRQPQ